MNKLRNICTIMLLSILFSITAFAGETFEIYINGVLSPISQDASSVHIKDGRTMVSLRSFSEKMGYEAIWNDNDKSISIPYKKSNIIFKIDNNNYTNENGETIQIDTAPYIKDGRTYIPLRAVSESLGYQMEYTTEQEVHTIVLNNNISKENNTFTVMVYMNATNLESDTGLATKNIKEMLEADFGENVNVIIETGGTSKWNTPEINPETNQRHIIKDKKLITVEDDLGKKNMGEASTLSDFINYSKQNYTADRYALLFWSHGWGPINGFGYEQHFEGDTLTPAEIDEALSKIDTHFSFVGFDSCLMSTVEIANIFKNNADYLIASEDLTPTAGWNYTRWLTEISENPAISTYDIANIICDDFYKKNFGTPHAFLEVTIATIDLSEVDNFQKQLELLTLELKEKLNSPEGLDYIKNARAQSKSYATNDVIFGGPSDMVDAIDFLQKLNLKQSQPTINAIKHMVVYNKSEGTSNNGISIYFPNVGTNIKASMDIYSKSLFNVNYYSFLNEYIEMLLKPNSL